MKLAAAVAVVVMALLIGIAVGMTLKSAPESSGPPDTASAAEIRRLDQEVDRLTSALVAAEAREQAAVEARAAGSPEPIAVESQPLSGAAGATAAEESADADEAEPGARFLSETYPCLDRVQWKDVGTSLSRMPALISGVARQILAGEKPDTKAVVEISQLNGNLVTAALTISEEVPGHAPNGFFTDPAFMLNAIAATLAAAELPLDEGQLEALEQTALAWMDRDRLRREGYDETTFELRKIREEAALKDRFFADAFELLTEAQLNTIEPEEIRLRLRLSLFSSGTLLVVWARPFPFTKPSDVVGAFFRTAQRTVGLEGEEEEAAREVIGRWLEGVPRVLMDETGNALDLEGMVEADRVIAWAKLTQDLLETLADRLGFDEDRLAKARNVQVIPVPVKKPAEER